MAGIRAQVANTSAMLEGLITNSRSFSLHLWQEGPPKGGTAPPPRVQGPRGLLHRSGGVAAEIHSQLCLDSWEREVLDPWVLAIIARGYRYSISTASPAFFQGPHNNSKGPSPGSSPVQRYRNTPTEERNCKVKPQ